MIKDPQLYIQHILKSILFIEEFIAGCSQETFAQERMRYDAVLRNLQTIAESTQKLPQSIKDKHPDIPWRDISGFRNILVHDYLDSIDPTTIWWIVRNELSMLKTAMLKDLQISIEPYVHDKHHKQLVELVSSIQQQEFNVPVTYENQPDLANIKEFYSNFWVACYGNIVVGSIGCKIYDNFAIIRKMFVHKDYRGKDLGIAQRLLTFLELECIENKIDKIYFGTVDISKAAHRFYEKNYFVEITKQELPREFPIMEVDTKFYTKTINK